MAQAPRTAPFDVVLAIRLLSPAGTLTALAEELAVAPSQVHASLGRLHAAGLLRPDSRSANPRALGEFMLYGVRYAFPARRGELTLGVPTAYSAPPLSLEIDAVDVVVWSSPSHPAAVQGFGIIPLYTGAPKLLEQSPATYGLLAVLDALRIGDPRSRLAARQQIEQALNTRSVGSE
jgi:hypothetical protein